jgi:FkbM family methyltransferase
METLEDRYARLRNQRSALMWHRLPLVAPAVDIVVDAGAGNGTLPLYNAFPKAKIIAIDPLIENEPEIRAHTAFDIDVHICAVGDTDTDMQMNVGGNKYGSRSSFVTRVGNLASTKTRPRMVPVRRLDTLINQSGSIGLKLDVEGFELAALRGAAGIMPQVRWIVAEASFTRRFADDPMFNGIASHLSDAFSFADFVNIRREGDGRLRLVDALFIRSNPERLP